MADERSERAAKGILEAVDTTQGGSRHPVALTLVQQDGLSCSALGQPVVPSGDAPPPDVHNCHTSTFPSASAARGRTRPPGGVSTRTVDAIEVAVVDAGTARAFPATAAG
ncbi:MAG: hypothetical protein ACXV5Q_05820 [Frankiaceae bacterium]